MTFPSRDEVARSYSESEAFDNARRLYSDMITARTPPEALQIAGEREALVLRPACELQLAGLYLLGGRELAKAQAVVVSLACFAVDHLLWGWSAALTGQPRIALTLSRAAVESSIFMIAAAEDFPAFERIWNTSNGTGGAVLRKVQKAPARVKSLFETVWNQVVGLGHASILPVMAARGTFLDGSEKGVGFSFAGQYAGPLDASVLEGITDLYCLASFLGVEAMKIAVQPLFTSGDLWTAGYEKLRAALDTKTPIPKHLEPYLDLIVKLREKGGKGKK